MEDKTTQTSPEKKNEMLESSKTLAQEKPETHVELLPCPFCGGVPTTCDNPDRQHRHFVFCTTCACEGSGYGEKARAIEAWNTRTPSDKQVTPTENSSTPPPQSPSPLQKEILGSTEDKLMESMLSVSNQDLKEGMRRALQEMTSLTSQLQSLTVERDELKERFSELQNKENELYDKYDKQFSELQEMREKVKRYEEALQQISRLKWVGEEKDISLEALSMRSEQKGDKSVWETEMTDNP